MMSTETPETTLRPSDCETNLRSSSKIRNGLSLGDILREYFPDESEDWLADVLWAETGYPCFWAGEPEDTLRLQLAKVRAREYNGEFGYFDSDKWINIYKAMEPPAPAASGVAG